MVIVAILGVVMIGGKNKEELPPPAISNAERERQMLIDATTGKGNSSITDPEVQKLIKATTGSKNAKGGNAGDREALIRATSGN